MKLTRHTYNIVMLKTYDGCKMLKYYLYALYTACCYL